MSTLKTVNLGHQNTCMPGSIAVGYDIEVNQSDLSKHSIGIGNFSINREKEAIVIGNQCLATGPNSDDIVIGNMCAADHGAGIAFGLRAETHGNCGIAIGTDTLIDIDATDSIAIGYQAHAEQETSLAMMSWAKTIKPKSIAIGYQSTSNKGVAIGAYTSAVGNMPTIAIGEQCKASGWTSTVIGYQSSAISNYSIALGTYNAASNQNTTAIGYQTEVEHSYSIGIGSNINIYDSYGNQLHKTSIGIGRDLKINYDGRVSLGYGNYSYYGGIAIGENVYADGTTTHNKKFAIAIGVNVKAEGDSCFVGGKGGGEDEDDDFFRIVGKGTGSFTWQYVSSGTDVYTNNGEYSVILGGNGVSIPSGRRIVVLGLDHNNMPSSYDDNTTYVWNFKSKPYTTRELKQELLNNAFSPSLRSYDMTRQMPVHIRTKSTYGINTLSREDYEREKTNLMIEPVGARLPYQQLIPLEDDEIRELPDNSLFISKHDLNTLRFKINHSSFQRLSLDVDPLSTNWTT